MAVIKSFLSFGAGPLPKNENFLFRRFREAFIGVYLEKVIEKICFLLFV